MAAEEKKDAAPAPAAETEAPAGPKMIMGLPLPLFAFAALNLLAMVGGIAYIIWVSLLYQKPPITEEHASTDIQKKVEQKALDPHEAGADEILETLSEMTVLLKGTRGGKGHYITVKVALACPSQRCADQVKTLKAKVEDVVQTSFSARSFTELGHLETKFRIKHEIVTKVNSFLTNTAVTDLYFETFLVQ